jgi:purine-cytosine permease-like protein
MPQSPRHTSQQPPTHAAEPRAALFEQAGVTPIPEAARLGTPRTFAAIILGASVALGSVVIGWIPITLGLGFWGALSSMFFGTLIGLVLVGPLILIGSRTATNNATASGAHFGVRGRLLGTCLGLASMLFQAAVTIWTAGSATVAVLTRLFGWPANDATLAATYLIITALVIGVAVYGYHLLVRVTTVLTVVGGLLLALALVAFAGRVDPGYRGGQYVLGSAWRTWTLSMIAVGIAGVLQLSTVLGDWTRYISPSRYPASRLLPVAWLAIVGGFVVLPGAGALLATAFPDPAADFPQSLASAAPGWYAVLLLPLALFGGLGLGAVTVYSSGLDLAAAAARLTRARATVMVSGAAAALVFAGAIVWDAAASILAALLLLLAVTAPWAAVVAVGYLRCHGQYRIGDLQVWNRRQRGGIYWFSRGWNWRAVVAWAAGAIWGVLAVNTPLYVGPLADLIGGVDVSFVGSFAVAAVAYWALETVTPMASTATNAAITTEADAAAAQHAPNP